MAEPRVGGIEALHQCRDAVFQMRQRRVIGVRQLHPFELLDQPREQLLELVWHRGSRFGRSGQRIGQRFDAVLERGEMLSARRGAGESIHFGGERAHVFGDLGQGLVGRDMGDDAAQGADGGLELLQRRRIVLGDDHVDLLRQCPHRLVETDQAFRGLEVLQRFAHVA